MFEDEIDAKRILREICLLRKLKHPNLIQMIELIPPKNIDTFDEIYMVLFFFLLNMYKILKFVLGYFFKIFFKNSKYFKIFFCDY